MQVLFWKGPSTWFGRLIRLRTGSAYTHCELLFTGGDRFAIEANIPARFYRQWPEEKITPGCHWDPSLWDCMEVQADEAKVRAFCVGEVGCKYDWLGIATSQLVHWGLESRDKWFCSELTVAALQAGDCPSVSGLKPHYVSPPALASRIRLSGGQYVWPPAPTT